MVTRLGVVMDALASIHYEKDSTLSMLWEAERRGWELYYFEQADLYSRDGVPYGRARALKVFQDEKKWYELGSYQPYLLADLDILLMRKDPPFNEEYIYTTYLLEQAEKLGVLVVNKPQSLRDANEKLFATEFPQCCPPVLVTQSIQQLYYFWEEYGDIVCKPLNSMGGTSVFRLQAHEVNAPVIFETLTEGGKRYMMAQQYLPAITEGDKRILLIDGEPIPYALARVPQAGDWRGNLAVGAKGEIRPLTKRDYWICEQVGPTLRKKGLYFVGLDVIGDYLTEINVTSPTGIRELEKGTDIKVSQLLMSKLEQLCMKNK